MGADVESGETGDQSIRWFGSHVAWIEEPDVYYVRFAGPVTGQELRDIIDYRVTWGTDKKAYYVLSDVTDLGAVSSDARLAMNEGRANVGVRVTNLIFGATFAVRVMVNMVNRAIKILRPTQAEAQGEVIFVATEAEARAEVEKRRAEFARVP
jgi:hypothetical protein